MGTDLIEAEIMEAAKKLRQRAPDILSLVLECTDMPLSYSVFCVCLSSPENPIAG